MNDRPISFLPQDTITPAIQNMGQTLGAINQQKIGQQEDLQKKFQSLIEASYEDIWSRDQQEVTKDWEALRGEAINTFKKASELGGPVNQMEYTGLMKKHKELIRKVKTARAAKADYQNAMTLAAKLKADEKLAPGSLEAIEQEKMNPKSIYDRKPFTSLISEQRSPEELLALEGKILDPKVIGKKVPLLDDKGERVMENGFPVFRDMYDKENVLLALDTFGKKSPDWAKQVSRPFGGDFEAYKANVVDLYDRNNLIIKPKRGSSSFNLGFGYGSPKAEKIPGVRVDGAYQYDVSQKNLNYTGKAILPDGNPYDATDAVVSKIVKYDDGSQKKYIMAKILNPKWINAGGSMNPLNPEPKTLSVEAVAPSEGEAETTLEKTNSYLERYDNTPAPKQSSTPKSKGKKSAKDYGL